MQDESGLYYGFDNDGNQITSKNELFIELKSNEEKTLNNISLGNYTVKENIDAAQIQDYQLKVSNNGTYQVKLTGGTKEVIVTNTYTLKTKDITVGKTWLDCHNQDGIRPDTITIKLEKKDKQGNWVEVEGSERTLHDQTVTKDEYGNWQYTYTGLQKTEGNVEIEYRVVEVKIGNDIVENNHAKGYTVQYDDTHLYITNTHVPEKETDESQVTKNADLILYKVDQDHNFLEGANFQIISDDGTIINPIKGKARFVFNDLADGNYKIVETTTPKGYEKIEEFHIVIENGVIVCPEHGINEPIETLTITNTNNGSIPEILGNNDNDHNYRNWESEKIDVEELGKKSEKNIKTSDNQNMIGYIGVTIISVMLFILLRKKKA